MSNLIKEFASKLNNRQYRDEIEKEEEQYAKENNLLVVFGHSDDCVEFRGVIYDEFSEGSSIIFGKKNETVLIETDTDDLDGFENFDGVFKRCKKLEAIEVRDCSTEPESYITSEHGMNGWEFKTDLPHEKFEIYDDEDLHGQGLVIDLSDFI